MLRRHRRLLLPLAALAGCQFPQPEDVPATDAPPGQVSLTVTIAGAGAGSILVAPGDFTCGSGTCEHSYAEGTSLTLTGAPTSDLDGVEAVTGDCTSLPCTLTMSSARSVSVSFRRFSCVPESTTCTAGRFSACGSDGEFLSYDVPNGAGEGMPTTLVMHDYVCPLGCHSTEPRCADVDTQTDLNAVLASTAVSPAGLDIVLPKSGAPAGTIRIDTSSYDAVAHQIVVTDTDGQSVAIPATVVLQPTPAPTLLVLSTRTLTLRTGSTIVVSGPHALAIATHFDLVVNGTIDLSAYVEGHAQAAPGGYNSGAVCDGHWLNGASGGGSNACGAGNASTGALRGDGAPVHAPYVTGGCPGGPGPGFVQLGGIGGGALGLVSRTRIRLGPASLVDVSGGGGFAGPGWATGGGSGGDIVIITPDLLTAAGARLSGRGGSGGAAGPTASAPGQEGPTAPATWAVGGSCSGCGTGGVGGSEAGCGSNGSGSGTALGGGGGGSGEVSTYTRATPLFPPGSLQIGHSYNTIASH